MGDNLVKTDIRYTHGGRLAAGDADDDLCLRLSPKAGRGPNNAAGRSVQGVGTYRNLRWPWASFAQQVEQSTVATTTTNRRKGNGAKLSQDGQTRQNRSQSYFRSASQTASGGAANWSTVFL
uniref:Uncharacterized protein n=1 Tax=Plectus sambesii TaxID=2011161 RepID=A0A914V000_9BILA